ERALSVLIHRHTEIEERARTPGPLFFVPPWPASTLSRMPYIKVDAEAFDEIVSEVDAEDLPPGFAENRPSGDFQYEASTASFKPSELSPVAQASLEALLALGATQFRVRY